MSEQTAVRREAVPVNILIVDDEKAIRETCAAVASQSGMKAVAVATAEEALDVLEHSAVDILLTDLKLPQANGVELLKLVHDLHPEVSVVVLTHYGTIESAVEVTRLGAVANLSASKNSVPASNVWPAPPNSSKRIAFCGNNCRPAPVSTASSASP